MKRIASLAVVATVLVAVALLVLLQRSAVEYAGTMPFSDRIQYYKLFVDLAKAVLVGVWWFLRPVVRRLSENKTVATAVDKNVADATRKDGQDDAYLVAYDLPRDEAEARSVAICKIIASDSLTDDGGWRLPLIVRLNEFSDGDVKKALVQLLQHFKMNNSMFVDRIIDSGRMVYLFTGADELKDKAPLPALLQSAHSQQSRSVVVTNAPLQFEKSALYKTIFRPQTPPSNIQDLPN